MKMNMFCFHALKRHRTLVVFNIVVCYILFYIVRYTIIPHWILIQVQTEVKKESFNASHQAILHNLLKKLPSYPVGKHPASEKSEIQIDRNSISSDVELSSKMKLNKIVPEDNDELPKTGLCSINDLNQCNEEQMHDLFGDKVEVKLPTPDGFFDVGRIFNDKKSLQPKDNITYELPKTLFPSTHSKSPLNLKLRAMKFPPDSALRNFMKLQKQRTSLVQKLCNELTQNNTRMYTLNAMSMILDRRNFITFCPVYKAASTSWSVLLLKMSGFISKKYKNIQKIIKQTFQRISNVMAPYMTKDTTKFIIVRHPFQRLISCYRDKFEDGSKSYYYDKYGEKIVQKYRVIPKSITEGEKNLMLEDVRRRVVNGARVVLRGNLYASPVGPTFEEFIKFIIHTKIDDEHWIPYHKYCAICHMTYDIILKFETLYLDSPNFLEYLNRTDIIANRWDNPTEDGVTTKEVVCQYFSGIPIKFLKKLAQKYYYDFKFFDYSPDEYFKCAKDFVPQRD